MSEKVPVVRTISGQALHPQPSSERCQPLSRPRKRLTLLTTYNPFTLIFLFPTIPCTNFYSLFSKKWIFRKLWNV